MKLTTSPTTKQLQERLDDHRVSNSTFWYFTSYLSGDVQEKELGVANYKKLFSLLYFYSVLFIAQCNLIVY